MFWACSEWYVKNQWSVARCHLKILTPCSWKLQSNPSAIWASIIDKNIKIRPLFPSLYHGAEELTHWGWMTHICVSELTIIGSDNGLSPGRRQAIIWTKDGILLIGPLGTNFSEILFGIQTFSFNKMHLKMSSARWRPFVSASMC